MKRSSDFETSHPAGAVSSTLSSPSGLSAASRLSSSGLSSSGLSSTPSSFGRVEEDIELDVSPSPKFPKTEVVREEGGGHGMVEGGGGGHGMVEGGGGRGRGGDGGYPPRHTESTLNGLYIPSITGE